MLVWGVCGYLLQFGFGHFCLYFFQESSTCILKILLAAAALVRSILADRSLMIVCWFFLRFGARPLSHRGGATLSVFRTSSSDTRMATSSALVLLQYLPAGLMIFVAALMKDFCASSTIVVPLVLTPFPKLWFWLLVVPRIRWVLFSDLLLVRF